MIGHNQGAWERAVGLSERASRKGMGGGPRRDEGRGAIREASAAWLCDKVLKAGEIS